MEKMNNARRARARVICGMLCVLLALLFCGTAGADTLEVEEFQVTSSSAFETTPTLGNDGNSDLVVFTVQPMVSGSPGPADIWYQRLDANGAPDGLPRQVSSASTDDQLNDVSGDYIVYTAYESTTSSVGTIMLYQISTYDVQPLGSAQIIQEPRIHGDYVVWREGAPASAQVMLYDLDWLGTGMDAISIAGPMPVPYDVHIGSRYVVWAERISGQYDIAAYDLKDGMCFAVTSTAALDETTPATSGAWVVWRAQAYGELTSTIQGINLDTLEMPVIVDNGACNYNPSMDGDLVTWESDVNGNMDVFVYRISTGETFQVTTDPADQVLDDVFGDLVAYMDWGRGLSGDIYVSKLEFVPTTCYPDLPAPELTVTGVIPSGAGSTKYKLSVTNWFEFPDELFEPAPDLPPCGQNPNAARTWVNIYEADGTYRYGFCALSSSQNLENILWFSVPEGETPPEYVYITLEDRRCGITYTSNLAWTNLRPVADAGEDQTVHAGSVATLDGSGSSDPDQNYPLSYAWAISSRPEGSAAELSDPASVSPSFTADKMGDYIIELTVTDSLGLASTADFVLVSTSNTPPVADAGPDQSIIVVGSLVQLDGTTSYDLDGDSFTYAWTITSAPVGSTAVLSDSASPNPAFVADVQGEYVITLVVTDVFEASSDPDSVIVSFENLKPVANAGVNQAVQVGTPVTLDGSGSSDANGDPLTYLWSIASSPEGSAAVLSAPTAVQTTITPDVVGIYVISLVVNDGFVDSDPSTVTVTATVTQSVMIEKVGVAIDVINSIDSGLFKNPNMQNALTNKLTAVIQMVEQGQYVEALDKLQNDILQKTDGCAEIGVPDKNDWIKDCAAQQEVYPLITEIIELLEELT
jgi:hypothetical protein